MTLLDGTKESDKEASQDPEEEDQETDTTENTAEETEKEAEETSVVQGTESKTTVEPAKATNEMKVVIVIKDDRLLLTAMAPDCDPVYTVDKDDLAVALANIPSLVEKAKAQWAISKRYPKANLPEPPPPPPAAPRSTSKAPEAPKAQPSFF